MSILQTGPLVRRFARNPLGRDLIVGDVHGHFTRLQAALDAVGARGANVYFIDAEGWKAPGHFTLLDANTLLPAEPSRPALR
jgi:hypothetical protein